MRILLIVMLVSMLFGALTYKEVSKVAFAQSTAPLSITVVGVHTSCTVAASTTTFCFASDGLWQSLSGAAYVQLGAAISGVSSITVCNAAGANCGTAATGAISLNIPTKAITTVTPTGSASAPIVTVTATSTTTLQ
jgi:hypothetical protein